MLAGTLCYPGMGSWLFTSSQNPTQDPRSAACPGPRVRNSVLSGVWGLGSGTGLQDLGQGLQKGPLQSTVLVPPCPQRQPDDQFKIFPDLPLR